MADPMVERLADLTVGQRVILTADPRVECLADLMVGQRVILTADPMVARLADLMVDHLAQWRAEDGSFKDRWSAPR